MQMEWNNCSIIASNELVTTAMYLVGKEFSFLQGGIIHFQKTNTVWKTSFDTKCLQTKLLNLP